MLIQRKYAITLLSFLVAIVIITSFFASARAKDGFIVKNVEISPKVVTNGESVRVKANLRNMENKTKSCCITAFVGESVVGEPKEITFSPQETISLLYTVNTTSLPQGNNAIDLVVEQPANKQEILDLGNIVVSQENVQQDSFAISNMLYLVPVFLIGAVISLLVWKRKRSKIQEQKLQEDLLPNLLNEVLNFEEKAEAGAEKTTASDDKSYIR